MDSTKKCDSNSSGCSTCGHGHASAGKPEAKDEALELALSKIKKKFLVMSGKGGVGKTSVSVNLAMALADSGFKVGIMDVDVHGPDIPRMLGMADYMAESDGKKLAPLRWSENLLAISIEALMPDKDTPVIWRGPLKHSAITQFIRDVNWGDLDFLIIDAPPGTGDEPMSVAQTIPDAQAIIVTTPQEVALADVRKSINFCRRIKMPVFGLIENMSGFVCPHCGKAVNLFGEGGGKKTAEAFGIQFLGSIPFDPEFVSAGDRGEAFVHNHKDSPITKAFVDIAKRLGEVIK